MESVSRLVYEAVHGPIPDGVEVMHICDNPPCLRPTHLVGGTPKDNGADKVAKGRQIRGVQIGTARLTELQVVEIRERYACGSESAETIARDYGFAKGAPVLAIVQGLSWTHVGGPRTLDDRRRQSKADLTAEDVRDIRTRYARHENLTSLGRCYGVTKQSIRAIVKRESWAHVH